MGVEEADFLPSQSAYWSPVLIEFKYKIMKRPTMALTRSDRVILKEKCFFGQSVFALQASHDIPADTIGLLNKYIIK